MRFGVDDGYNFGLRSLRSVKLSYPTLVLQVFFDQNGAHTSWILQINATAI